MLPSRKPFASTVGTVLAVLLLLGLATSRSIQASEASQLQDFPLTVEGARQFIEYAERELERANVEQSRIGWVAATLPTFDTELMLDSAEERFEQAGLAMSTGAARFRDVELPDVMRRQLLLIQLFPTIAPLKDPQQTLELQELVDSMSERFGNTELCYGEGDCDDLYEVEKAMAASRNPDELRQIWLDWHAATRPLRSDYERFLKLADQGARDSGFANLGEYWAARYEMSADQASAMLDEIAEQIRPLYEALHCHVRGELSEHYGADIAPSSGLIPSHLLGNLWAQDWSNIMPLIKDRIVGMGLDLERTLKREGLEPVEIARLAEKYYLSMGFDPLPDTFWERSVFEELEGRDMSCSPEPWVVDAQRDVRLKACMEVDTFAVMMTHHEFGHTYYHLAYSDQPYLYRESAIDAFHEGLGAGIGLGVNASYFRQIGMFGKDPREVPPVPTQLRLALQQVAFLPFAIALEQWRYQVYTGKIGPEEYNSKWWELREKYQGVAAPAQRTADDFDPVSKRHISMNLSYGRFLLDHVFRYQFHRALCEASGSENPLYLCTSYGSKAAGDKLREMMKLGMSRPWPEALKVLTGSEHPDASAIVDYFADLKEWLDQENQCRQCGW